MEKNGILAHSPSLAERFRRHRWSLLAAGSASAAAMATAIAVAPGNEPAPTSLIIEQLRMEGSKLATAKDTSYLQEERVQRGDTVTSLLARLHIQNPEALAFIRTSPEAKPIGEQLAPGKTITARTNDAGDLLSLHFPLNDRASALIIESHNGQFTATKVAERFETLTLSKSAEIRSSLFAAADLADVPDAISTQLAEIFGGDIDFHRDLRKGDRFSITYEMAYLRGQPVRSGKILSAEFINNGKAYRAIQFDNAGQSAYYTPDGKPLKKAFLRSPLEFSRVTSGFSLRFHPILNEWRAHKGVDYGAPQGTKVRAIGDGTVDFAGFQKGYGNIVVLKHAGNYSTAYAHLQNLGPGIRKGARVSQGNTVGHVGQTGWATGPHLHYEFRVNNQPVNPMSVNIPNNPPLDATQLGRFKAQATPLLSQLDILGKSDIAYAE